MHKIKTCYGYCPVQNTQYFLNIKYCICDINTYIKDSAECGYQSFYKNHCPISDNCPIFNEAKTIIND